MVVKDKTAPHDGGLTRTLDLTAESAPDNLWCRLAAGQSITRLYDGLYAIDDRAYYLVARGPSPQIREVEDGYELLVPVVFDEGKAMLSYDLIW